MDERETKFKIESTDKAEFLDHLQGPLWKLAVWEFTNEVLRPVIKYDEDEVKSKIYEDLRDQLYEIITDRGLSLD